MARSKGRYDILRSGMAVAGAVAGAAAGGSGSGSRGGGDGGRGDQSSCLAVKD